VWASSSPSLRRRSEQMTHRSIRDLARVFAAELDRCGADRAPVVLEALNVACSSGAWEVLRTERSLSVEETVAVVSATVTALLQDPR
jgi:hypothetical protein